MDSVPEDDGGVEKVQSAGAVAAGILVSTLGGSRVGRSITAIPEIVPAVGDECEIYVDSGIRSRALALHHLIGTRGIAKAMRTSGCNPK